MYADKKVGLGFQQQPSPTHSLWFSCDNRQSPTQCPPLLSLKLKTELAKFASETSCEQRKRFFFQSALQWDPGHSQSSPIKGPSLNDLHLPNANVPFTSVTTGGIGREREPTDSHLTETFVRVHGYSDRIERFVDELDDSALIVASTLKDSSAFERPKRRPPSTARTESCGLLATHALNGIFSTWMNTLLQSPPPLNNSGFHHCNTHVRTNVFFAHASCGFAPRGNVYCNFQGTTAGNRDMWLQRALVLILWASERFAAVH